MYCVSRVLCESLTFPVEVMALSGIVPAEVMALSGLVMYCVWTVPAEVMNSL